MRTKLGIGLLLVLGLVALGGRAVLAQGPEAEPQAAKPARGWLGLMLQEKGDAVTVMDVVAGSPADKAGLKEDDVVLEIDGSRVKDAADLTTAVRAHQPGDHVRIRVQRDGREIEQDVVVGSRMGHHGPKWKEWKEKRFGPGSWGEGPWAWGGAESKVRLGVHLQPLTDGLRGYFRVAKDQGVLVADVAPGSPAEKAGIKPGDVLIEVAGKAVSGHSDVVQALAGVEPGARVTLRIVRDGGERTVDAVVEERPKEERGSFCPLGDLDEKLGELGPMINQQVHEALERAHEEIEKHRVEIDGAHEKIKRSMEALRLKLQSV